MPINMKAASSQAAVLLTRQICPCRSSDFKKVQSEHAAMHKQLMQADAKAQVADAQCLELEEQNQRQQQQKQQLVAACQPVFVWVRPADPL
jgi:alpha-D-ribose 1-methylphosphonate 5-triphosphate synthase subunit PhnG